MEYDSDSELHATDTLRFDSDSEDDNHLNQDSNLRKNKNDAGNIIKNTEKKTENVQERGIAGVQNGSSEEEDNIGQRSTVRKSKFSNIIDSESEGDEVPPVTVNKNDTANTDTVDLKNRLQSLLDSDSTEEEGAETEKKTKAHTKRKSKKFVNSGSDSESEHKTKSKPSLKEKRKHKKDTKPEENVVRSARDILASLNLFFDDDDEDVAVPVTAKPRYSPSTIAEKSTYSSSEEDETTEGLMRSTRPIRKMTAKQAMEEKQIIQSESQRMAREKYIDVPYHRTKAFSFEEFRARKTICRPDPLRDCKGNFAAANKSIRMTAEQLEEFARKLEERERESQNFFKSESESEESEPEKETTAEDKPEECQEAADMDTHDTKDEEQEERNVGDATATEPTDDQSSTCVVPLGTDTAKTLSEEQSDAIDEIVNRTSENMEQMIASFSEPEKSLEPEKEHVDINYDLFSNDSSGKTTTQTPKRASLLASLKLPPCPRLSGNSDMLIDLDSGTLQPKQQSGADILFQRLVKCSGAVQKPASPSAKAISILSTEHGVVKLDTVKLFSNEERPLVHTEPTPGAAFLKLKQVLKEKIDNNRREYIRKREAEFAKKMDLEKADGGEDEEEEVELLEDEEEDLEEEREKDQEEAEEQSTMVEAAVQQKNTLLDDEALDEEMDESDESSSSDEDEEDDQETANSNKTGRRILKAFEDSDDEAVPSTEEMNKAVEIDRPTFLSDGLTVVSETATNNENPEESITLLWKDDEEQQDQREEDDDDLMALCSGQFATQLPTQKQPLLSQAEDGDSAAVSTPNQEPLYTQTQEPFRESQLMDLCSGRFETQASDEHLTANDRTPNEISVHGTEKETLALDSNDICVGGRLRLDSSDDEAEGVESKPKRKIKKHRRKQVNISDDEDDDSVEPEQPAAIDEMDDQHSDTGDGVEPDEDEDEDEAAEEGERYVDYDSEENEVEVRLTKKEKKLMSAKFVENEAELSESEWGSADEDEKDLDRYDVEMADEEQYDQRKLQQELEKIHNRQMLDQDDREVEQLKEFFIEDEENDGVGRVRQFRWKNVEKTFSLDYDKNAQPGEGEDGEGNGGNGSDEETELNWRKMRHERNLLLKEKNIDLSTIDLTATTLLNPADSTAVASDEQENVQMSGKKKITIIKKGTSSNSSGTSTTVVKEDNPFLISNSTFLQGHKASFLSRDQETLDKLASLIPETEGATSSLLTAKARNFVFATLSPAVEKTSKRSLDVEDAEPNANTKKAKTTDKQGGSRKKLLLDSQN